MAQRTISNFQTFEIRWITSHLVPFPLQRWRTGLLASEHEHETLGLTSLSARMVASSTSETWHLIEEGSLGVNVDNLFISKLGFCSSNDERNQKGQVSHSSFLLSFEGDERAEGLWRANFCLSLIIPGHTDRVFFLSMWNNSKRGRKKNRSLFCDVSKLTAKIDPYLEYIITS